MPNRIIFLLSIFTCFAFNLSGIYGSGVYVALILALYVFSVFNIGKIPPLSNNKFFIFFLTFIVICLLSNLWAIDRELSWEASSSLLKMWIAFQLMYCSMKCLSIEQLFKVIIWGGSLFFIYTILTTGVSQMIVMSRMGERFDGETFNPNMLGIYGAVVSVICFSSILNKGLSINVFAGMLGLLIVAITGSRKAFVILLLGFVLVYVLKRDIKNLPKLVFKIIGVSALGLIVVYFLFKLPLFAMYAERFEELSAFFSKSEVLTHSDWERQVLIEGGWERFLQSPFTGIGIDNGKHVSEELVGNFFYLHNNYIELLADVGIFGFLSFYMIYIFFGIKMLKLKNYWDEYSKLAVILLFMFVVADWGRVSYYYKDVLFVIMICYRVLEETQKRAKVNVLSVYKRIPVTQ